MSTMYGLVLANQPIEFLWAKNMPAHRRRYEFDQQHKPLNSGVCFIVSKLEKSNNFIRATILNLLKRNAEGKKEGFAMKFYYNECT